MIFGIIALIALVIAVLSRKNRKVCNTWIIVAVIAFLISLFLFLLPSEIV